MAKRRSASHDDDEDEMTSEKLGLHLKKLLADFHLEGGPPNEHDTIIWAVSNQQPLPTDYFSFVWYRSNTQGLKSTASMNAVHVDSMSMNMNLCSVINCGDKPFYHPNAR